MKLGYATCFIFSTLFDYSSERHSHELFISQAVLDEIKSGDPVIARKRMELVKNITVLKADDSIEKLALKYFELFNFPAKAIRDAFHIAYAVFYKINFMVTWNCSHLANANVLFQLIKLNKEWGFETPIICTPEELINNQKEE